VPGRIERDIIRSHVSYAQGWKEIISRPAMGKEALDEEDYPL